MALTLNRTVRREIFTHESLVRGQVCAFLRSDRASRRLPVAFNQRRVGSDDSAPFLASANRQLRNGLPHLNRIEEYPAAPLHDRQRLLFLLLPQPTETRATSWVWPKSLKQTGGIQKSWQEVLGCCVLGGTVHTTKEQETKCLHFPPSHAAAARAISAFIDCGVIAQNAWAADGMTLRR